MVELGQHASECSSSLGVCVRVDSGIPTACLLFQERLMTLRQSLIHLSFVLMLCLLYSLFDTFLCTIRVAFIEVQFEDIV